jgi:hypothetical protein
MACLNAAQALTALGKVDVELPAVRLGRDIGLKTLSDVGFVEWAAAVGET